MCNAILYALLAGVYLSAHLLRDVESLPVPTTTESSPISPTVSSDADTDESTAEASPEVSYLAAVASTSHQNTPGSRTSHTYTITIYKDPTSSPESDESNDERTDPNLPLSSAVVSSSTISEESCSSGVVQPGPCRKRVGSTERMAIDVLDSYIPGAKRSLMEANPSSPNWAVPNREEAAGTNETSSDSAHRQSRDSDSPSPKSSDKKASSASKSSSDSSSNNSQPGTPM